ncbi:hypothetical protein OSTOST_06177 [Ostertagia ostertagi]
MWAHLSALLLLLQLRLSSCALCAGSELTEELRSDAILLHNLDRASITVGDNRGPDGTVYPTAENMYSLKWSCGLERLARMAVRDCPNRKPTNPLYAGNMLQ